MKLQLIIMAAMFALQTTAAYAIDKCVPGKRRSAAETCVIDGDTIWLNGLKLRLKGFDTPEPQSRICGGRAEMKLAHKASARLRQLLNTNKWAVQYFGKERRGKGRRTLATIRIKGRDVGDILIEEKLARRWPDGREWWCE